MSYQFARSGPIVVRVRIEGPSGVRLSWFALDTGAERTCIHPRLAQAIGVPVADGGSIWTASERVPVRAAVLPRLDSLGLTRFDFSVLVHRLPDAVPYRGLLGLDFLRNTRLTIDFRRQTLQVADAGS